jgi:four helix bundle protein
MHNYKELKVWQKSVDLAVEVYKVTGDLPKEEKFGLSSQMNRAVISISSNIAEGASRTSNKDFANFLKIALGSALNLKAN